MNYFELYPGDYMRKTADLSLMEHGAYLMLLASYYSTEGKLPADLPALYRISRAMTKHEKEAVTTVEDRFFPINGDGSRHNYRADQEIEKARKRIETSRRNGKKGGRPVITCQDTQQVTGGIPDTNPSVTCSGKALHVPHATEDQELSTSLRSVDVGIEDSSPPQGNGFEKPKANPVPYEQIVNLYHESLPMCPRVYKLTKTRKGLLSARWKEDLTNLDEWKNFFDFVGKSKFLTGKATPQPNKPPFIANLEWLTSPGNFAKIAEENYHRG